MPRSVVALPEPPTTDETSDFLQRVDRQLADVLDGLTEAWAAEDARAVDVLLIAICPSCFAP